MQTCPRCSTSVQDGAAFCPSCGNGIAISVPSAAPPYSSPPGPYTGPQETSGKAIGSLICGLLFFIPLAFIVAIVLGHMALSEIKKSAGRLKGQGLAIAGLVLGYGSIVLAIPVILIIAAIAIPNLLRSRMAANEASAVGTLRTYNIAIVSYASKCENIGFPAAVANLGPGQGDCQGANLVEPILASPNGLKSGYLFFYSPGPADANGRVLSYTITADPVTQNTTGIRHFFTDESGVIRFSAAAPANADSAPLQ